jgi:zona occludens toxin (predicted ATPase)
LIWFYSGTPGSGKSFHTAKDIRMKLRKGQDVISTVNIDVNNKSISKGKKKKGRFVYVPITEITPKYLYEYAFKNHKKGKEGQTLIILDECQIIFNPREFQRTGRSDWILFFTKHRHLGYNVIMISQFDRLVDRQIRSLFEYEVKHRKVNNRGLMMFLPFTLFSMVTYWYGVKLVVGWEFMRYQKKVAAIYDSYVMYDEFKELMLESGMDIEVEDPQPAGAETGAGGPRRSDGRSGWSKELRTAEVKY